MFCSLQAILNWTVDLCTLLFVFKSSCLLLWDWIYFSHFKNCEQDSTSRDWGSFITLFLESLYIIERRSLLRILLCEPIVWKTINTNCNAQCTLNVTYFDDVILKNIFAQCPYDLLASLSNLSSNLVSEACQPSSKKLIWISISFFFCGFNRSQPLKGRVNHKKVPHDVWWWDMFGQFSIANKKLMFICFVDQALKRFVFKK